MHLHDATHTLRLGAPLAKARGVVILLHGRGSSADDIAGLADVFGASDLTYLVPEAANSSWYPHRFLVPPAQNEPWLSSALAVIDTLVAEALVAGIPSERIGLAGFSQGACLSLEYASRHPRRYAFVAGLSGALIGPTDTTRDCIDLQGTPVLVACAERDAHIPLDHVEHSATALAAFNATVTKHIFPGSAHNVFPEEVAWLKKQAASLPRSA
ncbi:alpha/beta hydrolase [Rariglobus hedericola]|uniref:Phospholipase n=1 Tax=Rariglobus hedericola TaxID=2597822 RepID=A0A556QGN2_9BACT|nr:dienelactone hydrolase family protein [Rariglobus hedericola]TSJ75794.1 phospholipase [Rariglobus hedericola]